DFPRLVLRSVGRPAYFANRRALSVGRRARTAGRRACFLDRPPCSADRRPRTVGRRARAVDRRRRICIMTHRTATNPHLFFLKERAQHVILSGARDSARSEGPPERSEGSASFVIRILPR